MIWIKKKKTKLGFIGAIIAMVLTIQIWCGSFFIHDYSKKTYRFLKALSKLFFPNLTH
jgi:hypothetical protein